VFWADEERSGVAAAPADDDEPQLFPNGAGPAGTHMRSVQAAEPPVDDNAWLAALERDLFGGPAEPPRPSEEPPPTPQPIETPQPQEVPVTPQPPAQPGPPTTPPTRAPRAADEEVD
jgi:hypothetical protein